MSFTLLTLPLRNKRDAMMARQRTRQLAGLLGYDLQDQAAISAGVFAVAWQVLSLQSPVELCFDIEHERLRVFARARSAKESEQMQRPVLCLEKPLPARTKLSMEDVQWAVERLDRITPTHMYDEVYRLNQELLATLHALQQTQHQLAMMKEERPNAA